MISIHSDLVQTCVSNVFRSELYKTIVLSSKGGVVGSLDALLSLNLSGVCVSYLVGSLFKICSPTQGALYAHGGLCAIKNKESVAHCACLYSNLILCFSICLVYKFCVNTLRLSLL